MSPLAKGLGALFGLPIVLAIIFFLRTWPRRAGDLTRDIAGPYIS
jgi:hypothetical protein